ncbi:MAG: class II aldolase/adducin family protein [Nitrososphaerota archaeon]|nr:class II aldolase/adducin family protein [Nitrososphaerota archaeon]MDG6953167.1 class II aldolase/adducin family protein [Nitrososphaerota archaeon]MDG6957770.1 class II aldolase/adducin family protein [Nitrososphaerota archaeon]MDG6972799.1 class II aldolase/adducin family protein [Nitrososphaerota archaeon]MDG6976902.1 class II aldolase/adducin family protein [Nitrososphaerota archaeon]
MAGAKPLGEELARTIRRMYERGLVSGVGGNASALLDAKDQILITPAGYFKGGVARGDLVRVRLGGKVVGRGRPSSELPTHLAAYRAREDVNAVVHGHPPNAVGLISAGMKVPVMTPEHAVMIRQMEVVDYAVPGEDCARAIATQLKRCDVVGIKNHGFFSMGRDLHEAASRLEVLEESAKIYLAGRLVGGAPGLGDDGVKKTREAYGRE